MSSELFEPAWYMSTSNTRSKKLTSAQLDCLLRAQGYAVNTYVEYAQRVYSNHLGSSYDVCGNSRCCHNYDPSKVTQRHIECSARLFSSTGTTQLYFHLLPGSGFEYMCSMFFSSCYGQGTLTDVYQPNILIATPCSDFDTGYGGHGKGLCQMGAAELARKNYSSHSIMTYYFTDVIPLYCKLTARQ